MEEVRPTPSPRAEPPYVRRRIVVGLVALALVVGITTLVRSIGGGEEDAAPPTTSGTTVETVVEPPDTGGPDESAAPSDASTTTGTPASDTTATAPEPIRVSLDRPPPAIEPAVVARIQPTDATTEFGVMRDGWVVFDTTAPTATVYDRTGAVVRSFAMEVVPSPFVVGPDDVLYGMTPVVGGRRSMVAIPLDGLAAGMIAAQTPVLDPAISLDAPAGMLGVGVEGIVDRVRTVGTVLMPYLALDGTPITYPDATFVTMDTTGVVRASTGVAWQLEIMRGPEVPDAGFDIASLVPSPAGAVYAATLGAPSDGSPTGTRPAIAQLSADGTGRWSSLPEGWRLAAGSRFGTLLRRDTTVDSIPTVEVAWLS